MRSFERQCEGWNVKTIEQSNFGTKRVVLHQGKEIGNPVSTGRRDTVQRQKTLDGLLSALLLMKAHLIVNALRQRQLCHAKILMREAQPALTLGGHRAPCLWARISV